MSASVRFDVHPLTMVKTSLPQSSEALPDFSSTGAKEKSSEGLIVAM